MSCYPGPCCCPALACPALLNSCLSSPFSSQFYKAVVRTAFPRHPSSDPDLVVAALAELAHPLVHLVAALLPDLEVLHAYRRRRVHGHREGEPQRGAPPGLALPRRRDQFHRRRQRVLRLARELFQLPDEGVLLGVVLGLAWGRGGEEGGEGRGTVVGWEGKQPRRPRAEPTEQAAEQ